MDYPVSITPYRIWNSTAFNGAYKVTSESTGFIPFELYDSKKPSGKPDEGLSVDALKFYTNIDDRNKTRLGDLASSITNDIPGYYDKVLALTAYLHDGDYRYSLKPGIAPDGDQLSYFLFTTKKGYCTYFAFSLCLMLRSIGIPSRVAAGFFIQPGTGALDYYPVRANMAHAWVEVFFPNYGWIAFDPTTTQLADGEDLQFANNPGGDEFLQRLNEIIDKRSLMTPDNSDAKEIPTDGNFAKYLIQTIQRNLRKYALFILALAIVVIVVSFGIRYYLTVFHSGNPRKKILFLSKRLYRKIATHDTTKILHTEGRSRFVESFADEELSIFFTLEQKARYSPVCTQQDAKMAHELYKTILKKRRPERKGVLSLLFMIATLCFLRPNSTYAEQPKTNTEILTDARAAIKAENWETAISTLNDGITAYPGDPAFHYELGNLYADKKLYAPAFRELSTAQTLGYADPEIFSKLSDTAGYLNRDEEALIFLKKYLEIRSDDVFAWSNFGWLCYKTNRLDEGIKALLGILDKQGPDGNLYVGLGNLYTAAFNYDAAKKYYTLAIRNAEEHKQPYLTSIYYYNRSILEEMFYHFDAAYDDTTRSLEESARSSGYLMQGELELRRLDYKAALSHYMKAFSVDSTPLAAMGLADTLLQAGYPEEAEHYVNSVKAKEDLSWIANYGTTTDQFKADLYKIQRDIYQYKKNKEKRTIVHNLSTFISRTWNVCLFSFNAWFFDTLFRIQNDTVARYYEKSEKAYNKITGQGLYINSFYYLAFNKWQKMAKPYLSKAEALETSHIPEAKPSYIYEHAIQEHKIELFDTAIRTLDPVWERQYLAKALAERLKLSRSSEKKLSEEYAYKLFSLTPAAFIYYDRLLPVSFSMETYGKNAPSKKIRHLQRLLQHSGFSSQTASVIKLSIKENETDISLQLVDTLRNTTIYTQKMHKNIQNEQDIHMFINSFSTGVFRTDLDI
jgi:tetratricopeptide (TPR) repeat protein